MLGDLSERVLRRRVAWRRVPWRRVLWRWVLRRRVLRRGPNAGQARGAEPARLQRKAALRGAGPMSG